MGSRAKRETDLTIAIDRVRASEKEEPSDHSRPRTFYRMRTWANLVMSQHRPFEDLLATGTFYSCRSALSRVKFQSPEAVLILPI